MGRDLLEKLRFRNPNLAKFNLQKQYTGIYFT
jgi:hypothetical protein